MKNFFKQIIIYILQIESRLVLRKYKPKVIAITGSVGKTSTKDAVYAVLSEAVSSVADVRKSDKSFNSEIGLPLTILGCPNGWSSPTIWATNIFQGLKLILQKQKYPEWLILEVGVGKPGDMQATASWLKTNAVVITAIGETPAHIEFFHSRKHLIEEKSELIQTLKKTGILILNADDPDVLAMKNKTKQRVFTYGFKDNEREKPDLVGSADNILYNDSGIPEGIIFRVDEEGNSLPVVIEGVFGRNHVYASLGALAIASVLKFNMLEAIDALKNYDVPPGRMHLLEGIEETLIIDDTYNSSPLACKSALKTLGEIKTPEGSPWEKGRKIAILGDMLELGRHTLEAHKKIGQIAKENLNTTDILIVVGQRAKAIKEGAVEAGMNEENTFEFLNSTEAGEFIKTFVKKNDIVLIKGSQGMRMEKIVEVLLKDKNNKDKLLVRQDDEWLRK